MDVSKVGKGEGRRGRNGGGGEREGGAEEGESRRPGGGGRLSLGPHLHHHQ